MSKETLRIFIFGLFVFLKHVFQVKSDEQEYRLTRYLMSNYDPAVRPSHNATQPLRVAFDLSLQQVISLDEWNQILSTNCRITQKWTDVHLRWNASDFGGIAVIRLPTSQVWKPDIILYNNADSFYTTAIITTNVIVRASGEVTWMSHAILRSSCEIDVEYFPFDIQTCHLKFASWTYDGLQVELVKERDYGDISDYQPNGQFDLDEFYAKLNVLHYSCCEEPYPDITYTLKLRRRPVFSVLTLILPCLVANGISILVFYIPSESGEKVTLGVGTLISLTVLLVLIRNVLPPTPKTPLLCLFYLLTIIIIACTTIFSIVTLNVHHRGGRGFEVPHFIRRLILGYLARIVFISCGSKGTKKQDKEKDIKSSKDDIPDQSIREEKLELDHIEHYKFSPRLRHRKEIGSTSDVSADEFERQFLRVLNKVYETIEKNEMRLAEQDRKEIIKSEWQQVALVCDRLLLAVFLLGTATASFLVLFSSPHGP